MKFHELVFEYIARNSGLSKDKIFETEKDVMMALVAEREKFQADPTSVRKVYQIYFKWEKDAIVMTCLLLAYTVLQHLERYRFDSAEFDDDPDE